MYWLFSLCYSSALSVLCHHLLHCSGSSPLLQLRTADPAFSHSPLPSHSLFSKTSQHVRQAAALQRQRLCCDVSASEIRLKVQHRRYDRAWLFFSPFFFTYCRVRGPPLFCQALNLLLTPDLQPGKRRQRASCPRARISRTTTLVVLLCPTCMARTPASSPRWAACVDSMDPTVLFFACNPYCSDNSPPPHSTQIFLLIDMSSPRDR